MKLSRCAPNVLSHINMCKRQQLKEGEWEQFTKKAKADGLKLGEVMILLLRAWYAGVVDIEVPDPIVRQGGAP